MKDKKKIGRREFLKVAGTGAAVTTAALYGCKPRSAGSASEADGARQGQMTYRTNPKTGVCCAGKNLYTCNYFLLF